jgi:hypothetical protein
MNSNEKGHSMKACIEPGRFSDDELAQFALEPKDADRAIAEHVQACRACEVEVADLRSIYRGLERTLDRFSCPPVEDLEAFVLGQLPPLEKQAVAGHIQSCGRCTEEIEVTTQVLLKDPLNPAGSLPRFLGALLRHPAGTAGAQSQRSGGAGLEFHADDQTVVYLDREYSNQQVVLSARIVPADDPKVSIPITAILDSLDPSTSAGPWTVAVKSNYVEFPTLPRGIYRLTLILTDRLIEIPSIDL